MSWPKGHTAFVTGAASGIGLGIARALVRAGAKVALADIDEGRVIAAAAELGAGRESVIGLSLDVADPTQWTAAANEAEAALGPVTILCNNAGVNGGGALDATPLEVWRWVYRVNVEGQFLGISTFLPRFKSRGGRAHIVNTASMVGLVPMPGFGPYSSAKFASFGLSAVLRTELEDTEIGVSVLCPGTVATRIAETSGNGEAGVLGTGVDQSTIELYSAMSALGADPDNVGQQVVEAMQQRQFLIVTHREWEPLVSALHAEIREGFESFDGRHGPDESARMMAQSLGRAPA